MYDKIEAQNWIEMGRIEHSNKRDLFGEKRNCFYYIDDSGFSLSSFPRLKLLLLKRVQVATHITYIDISIILYV